MIPDGRDNLAGPIFSRAFTLLELMVVVVLLGLAAAIVTVRLDGMSNSSRLNGAALRIEQSLRLTCMRAQSGHEPAWMAFAVGSDRYRLGGAADQSAPQSRQGVWHAVGGVVIAAGQLGDQRAAPIRTGEFVVQVTPSGATLPWALELSAGPSRCVAWTDGFSGRVQHQDGSLDQFRWDERARGSAP